MRRILGSITLALAVFVGCFTVPGSNASSVCCSVNQGGTTQCLCGSEVASNTPTCLGSGFNCSTNTAANGCVISCTQQGVTTTVNGSTVASCDGIPGYQFPGANDCGD